ncbi:MAG: hypothetical protein E6167_06895 [Varibaculum cambriense]|nr:hypothetical protein [Varibaculum cambriense]MDU5308581.1 hypothetical protein [Varibaculum cambriense]
MAHCGPSLKGEFAHTLRRYQDGAGRRKRIYDTPATPLNRLLTPGILSRTQTLELRQLREITNPAELTRDILRYQSILTGLAKTSTGQLLAKTEETREKRKNKLTTGIKTQAA